MSWCNIIIGKGSKTRKNLHRAESVQEFSLYDQSKRNEPPLLTSPCPVVEAQAPLPSWQAVANTNQSARVSKVELHWNRKRKRKKSGQGTCLEGLTSSVEKRRADKQLHQDAAKAPEINLFRVNLSKNDFWRAIEAALYILVNLHVQKKRWQKLCDTEKAWYRFVLVTRAAKVNHFDCAALWANKQNVFWFEVAMDDVSLRYITDGLQNYTDKPEMWRNKRVHIAKKT